MRGLPLANGRSRVKPMGMDRTPAAAPAIPPSLFAFSIFYGGMVPLGGFLGVKQVGLGPLAVEAGIFPFLTLVAASSAIAELHGRDVANRLVRWGFVPLIVAIALTFFVLQLPTDPGMYEPAKAAFPIVVRQGGRMMIAGIMAYGVSVSLNIWLFDKLRSSVGRFAELRGFIAAALSQIVDTLIFITVSFLGVRPILDLMIGQALAKVVLSAVMVPLIIALMVRIGRRLDAGQS